MKINRGSLKGRNIVCPAGIRPVSILVRKACFDILGAEIQGKSVLDLFAGSGSLGLEALSNAAKDVVFIDVENRCIEALKKNVLALKINEKAEIYLKDAFMAINDFHVYKKTFDLIFLDPPYYRGIVRKTLQTLEEHDILAPSGYVIGFCYIKDEFIKDSRRFCLLLDKKYGQTRLLVYRKEAL